MMSEFNRRDGFIRNLRRHRYADDKNASVEQNDFVTFDYVMKAMQSRSMRTKQLILALEARPRANLARQRVQEGVAAEDIDAKPSKYDFKI